MQLKCALLGLTLVFLHCNLDGQTNHAERLTIPFFDSASQSNVVVTVCNLEPGQPCPLEYTNTLSNTNLFSTSEQKLLKEVMLKYKNVTTNSGPPGTVLVSLYKTNFIIMSRTNENWAARFQYTNSDAQEEVWFGNGISPRYLTKAGNGYSVGIGNVGSGSMIRFGRIKRGVMDGLQADFLNNNLQSYMHYSNGMAIGKFFMWNPRNNNLLIEAEFKEPYDLQKHQIQFQQ